MHRIDLDPSPAPNDLSHGLQPPPLRLGGEAGLPPPTPNHPPRPYSCAALRAVGGVAAMIVWMNAANPLRSALPALPLA